MYRPERVAIQPPKSKPPCGDAAGQPERALTLIELMITMALMFALVGVLWGIFNTGFTTAVTESLRSSIKGESGRGIITLGSELRQALSVTTAQAANITFTADTDDDGAAESIQYIWAGAAGNPLNRVAATTFPLVNSVSTVSFSYYDSNNNLLAFPVTASQVRVVGIDITVTNENETFRTRSQVRLRNL